MDKKTAPSGTERIIDIPDSVGLYEAMDLCDALYRAGHTAKSEGSDSCSDARSKPEWLECHAAFNRQGRALLRATTALAEAEARIAELESLVSDIKAWDIDRASQTRINTGKALMFSLPVKIRERIQALLKEKE